MAEAQKTAVVFGLANKRSIAWAIAQKLQEAGWRMAITYQNERLAAEAADLINDLPGSKGVMCDVASDEQIAKTAAHPNAARLFLNWCLSEEGQTMMIRELGYLTSLKKAPVYPEGFDPSKV